MKGKIYKNKLNQSRQNQNLTTDFTSMTAYKSPSRLCQSPIYKYYEGHIKKTAARENDTQGRRALTRVVSNPHIFNQLYNQNGQEESSDKIHQHQIFNRSQSWLQNQNNQSRAFKYTPSSNIERYMKQNMIGSQYVAQCQRRQRQRILTIQKTFELQIQQYEETLKSKDNIIEQLKKSLEEKQKVISRLQQQNCNLSSRSFCYKDSQRN